MTKKSKMILGLASMLGVSAGAAAVSGFAWFTTTKSATVSVSNIGVYSKSSALAIEFKEGTACTGSEVTGGINVVGDPAATTTTEIFTATDTSQTFELDKHPCEDEGVTVSIKRGDNTTAGTGVTVDEEAKTVTVTNSIQANDVITITYTPYEAMTDVSSVDGKTFYKPTWTATGEGRYATAVPTTSTGFVKFTMTLSATGASGLVVYANTGVTITPADDTNPNDLAAAGITRVAVIDDEATGSPTRFVTQNATSAGNVGIDADWAAAANVDLDGAAGDDGWDLKATGEDALTEISNLVQANAIADKSAHDATWAASHQTYADGYITTIPAGESRDVTVAIWLEGTNDTNANGGFLHDPEKGMIGVNLPLLAI